MPEQQSNPNQTRARLAVRRFTRAASLSIVAVAACAAPPAFAQNATKPRPVPKAAAQRAKPAGAKVKASKAQQDKPASSASEITRARRAVVPAAVPAAATPAAAVAAPAVSAPEDGAALKPVGEEAELERLRAELKDVKPGAERTRLQRSLVDALVKLKRNDEALDALRLMIHEDRFDPPFFFNTGNALARLGDASAAEDAYRKAILQRRGNYARALNNLGVILIRQGHWDEARETFAAALLQENYTYAEASYNLGRLHLLRGEANLAIREWQRTLRLEPTHAEAAAALARAYTEDGDANRGLAVLDNFAARSTRSGSGVPREIAQARRELVEANAAGDAEEEVVNVKASANANAGVSSSRVASNSVSRRVAGENRARPAASNTKLRAHAVDRATYNLLQTARAQRESGQFEESVKRYRSVLQRSPAGYFPPANLELGTALINLKRDEEAIAALLPLMQKDSARYPIASYYLGRLYERQGQNERAAHHFGRAAELYGDANPQVLIDVSRTREKIGDTAGALAAMNAYAVSIARQGTVPEWVAERQAKLNQKVTGTGATRSSTAKP